MDEQQLRANTAKLLFIHAITGCDTTSRLYGIGKTLSKVQCSDEFTKISEVFMQENANKDDFISAGEKALVLLYNGADSGDDLDHRQYRFQNGLETGSRARIKSTQTVQEGPCCQRIAVANAVLAYSVEVWG